MPRNAPDRVNAGHLPVFAGDFQIFASASGLPKLLLSLGNGAKGSYCK
jgi:hypothetical protein